ncbi:MAG: hypothetical protein OXE46_15475 [Chloroflexi bacterium]|nr:hypothetical protein [Chloroflexota bacterium]
MRNDKLQLPATFGARRIRAFAMLLLIVGSLPVSLVNAADISTEDNCTLAQAIESANQDRAIGGCVAGSGADHIELTADIMLTAELPAINSPIAIMGGGFAISGDKRFRIFFVAEDGELTIDNLTLRDGQATADARMCIDWGEDQWTTGGAICNLGALSISESQFSGNGAEFGGAIASIDTLTISGGDFNGNAAYGGGAIFDWADGELTVMASNFTDNTARIPLALLEKILADMEDSAEESDVRIAVDPVFFVGHGGAIASSLGGAVTITETTFRSNLSDFGGGALLDHSTTEIIDCQFINNSSSNGSGGAIESRMGAVSVTGSDFSGNSAQLGGAVQSWGNFVVVDSLYNNNTAVRGGAINTVGGMLSVTGSVFSDNSATQSGGAIFNFNWAGGLFSATDSVFSGNSASQSGGAIFGSGTVQISGSQFRRNAVGDLGGAIINEGTLTVTDSEFSENSAGIGGGGGIYNPPDNELSQDGNIYSDNRGGDCEGCD